jgi:hypothetical protein
MFVRPARLARLSGLSLVLILAGCAGDIALRTTISGGRQVVLPLKGGMIAHTVEGDLESDASFDLDKVAKTFSFRFELAEKNGRVPRRIRVEDVSENAPVLLLDDPAPRFAETTRRWQGVVGPLAPTDQRIAWISTRDDTTRVYRFTVETADGRTVEMLQGTLFHNYIKTALRQVLLGEKY